MVVAADARRGQARGLLVGEQSERARDLEPGLVADRADRVDHLAQESLLRTPHRDDDAELRRARGPRRVGGREHLVEVEERVHVDRGVEAHRLRAERAVFGARARFRVDEALELDRGTHVREAHAVRERDERGQVVERHRGDGVDLGT